VERSRVSGTSFVAAVSETSAIGRLTKKIERQLQPNRLASVSTPPSTSPIAEAKPRIAP
jgi:hypothetical protein